MVALQKKRSGYRPDHLQFKCKSCWYNFTEDTEYDDLCLKDNSPELFIKALSVPIDTGD